jgi:hypothetical protein
MGHAWRYSLAISAFAIASGAIAPLSVQADTPITQLEYDGSILLGLPDLPAPLSDFLVDGFLETDFVGTIEVDDLENRLASGESLTPTFSQIKSLLGAGFFEDAFFGVTFEVQEFSGSGTVFGSAGAGAPALTGFLFRYVEDDQDRTLVIDGYLDAFNNGALDQCLNGTCFIQGSGSGLLTGLFSIDPQPFTLDFAFTQTATPLGSTAPPVDDSETPLVPLPDDGVAVPEPSVGLGLLAIAGGGLMLKRRQDRAKQLETA